MPISVLLQCCIKHLSKFQTIIDTFSHHSLNICNNSCRLVSFCNAAFKIQAHFRRLLISFLSVHSTFAIIYADWWHSSMLQTAFEAFYMQFALFSNNLCWLVAFCNVKNSNLAYTYHGFRSIWQLSTCSNSFAEFFSHFLTIFQHFHVHFSYLQCIWSTFLPIST